MKKIAFHSNQLGIRGTEVALYDYAHFNETILKNIQKNNKPKNYYKKNVNEYSPENGMKRFNELFLK